MLERDPELEALLAPERVTPPEPSPASKERLWQRISVTVRSAPSLRSRGPALLAAALVGAGLGGWAVWSGSRPDSVSPPPTVVVTNTTPVPAPPAPADAGAIATPTPTPTPVVVPPALRLDSDASRRTIREALKANRLGEATSALGAHEAAFPKDDVREERAALLVLTHAFAETPALPVVLRAFQTSHPNSELLVALAPQEPHTTDAGCTLTGRVAFSSDASSVHLQDLLVFLTPKLPPRRRDTVHEVRAEDGGIAGGVLVVQTLDRVKLIAEGKHHLFSRNPLGKRPVLPGAYPLRCDSHQGEHGTLYVVPDPKLSTRLSEDGSWTLSGLPTGRVSVTIIEPNGAQVVRSQVDACNTGPLEETLQGNAGPFVEYQ